MTTAKSDELLKDRKTATTVYLRADQFEALKKLSQATHVPMAEYIRQGVEKVLKRNLGGEP